MTARLTQEYVEAGTQPDEYYRRLTQEYVEVGAKPDEYYRRLTQFYVEVGVLLEPEISTGTPSGIGYDSATLNGNLVHLGLEASVNVYFQYRVEGGVTWEETVPVEKTETGAFSASIGSLLPLTSYEFRAAVAWNSGASINYGEIQTFETVFEVLPGELIAGIQYDVPEVDEDSFILSLRFRYDASVLPLYPRHFFIEVMDATESKIGKISIYRIGTSAYAKLEIYDHSTVYTVVTQDFTLGEGYIDPEVWVPGVLAINGSNISVQIGYMLIAEAASPVANPFDGVSRLKAGLIDCGAGDVAFWWDDIRWDVYSSVVFNLLFEGAHGSTSLVESARNYALSTMSNCQIDGVEKDGALQCLRLGITTGTLARVEYKDIFLIKPTRTSFSFGFKYEGGNWTAGQLDSFRAILGIKESVYSEYPNFQVIIMRLMEESGVPYFELVLMDPATGDETIVYYVTDVYVPSKDTWHHVNIQTDNGFLYFIVDDMELAKIAFGSGWTDLPFSYVGFAGYTGWSGITKLWISDVKIENDGVYEVPSKEFVAWDFDPCNPLLGYTKLQTEIFS